MITDYDSIIIGSGAGGLTTAVALAQAGQKVLIRQIVGGRLRDLLNQNGPEFPIYPSEDVTQWPEHLQQRIANRRQ